MQITYAGIKHNKCSKFGQSGLFTLELPALIAEKTIFDILGLLNSGDHDCTLGDLLSFLFPGDSLSTVECFDPILGRWTVAEAMSTMRSRVGVTVLNGE